MPGIVKEKTGLTGNQLKILAMIAMTCDHIGLQLLPQFPVLRVIGRLALPIYAFMIAEGCRHTHDRRNYLLRLAGLAAICQFVYFFAMGSLYQCILVTFSLSLGMIYARDYANRKRTVAARVLEWTVAAVIAYVCVILPLQLPGFAVDYGIWGVLLPYWVYYSRRKPMNLAMGLVVLALDCGGIQWLALAAVPLLMLYNGQRGNMRIGKLFYFYYPVHLVVIYLIGLFI